MKILFLLKKNYSYGSYSTCKSGLFNSCQLTAEELKDRLGMKTIVEVCVDGNEIDKFLHKHKPKLCIVEAIWVTPDKFRELQKLHPKVTFINRIHSRTPFLAMEGMSFTWIKEYITIPKVFVGFNNEETHNEMVRVGIDNVFLPNLYPLGIERNKLTRLGRTINIGCFGAIRPLKNQLLQAVAAISYGNKYNKNINFHVNAGRLEQRGDEVLRNLRALFSGTRHNLIEHPWMNREDFLSLVGTMDIGLQVSMTESFNIVTADFVKKEVPIIVSDDISWMPFFTRVADNDSVAIMDKIHSALSYRRLYTELSTMYLRAYNKESLKEWEDLLS